MNDSVFNLTPDTLAKIKEAQNNLWKLQPGPNGEPAPEVRDDTPWQHQWLEKVKIEKVERKQEDNGVTVITIQLRCVQGPNMNRVHTEWIRLYPPFDDGGFGRRTLENIAKLGAFVQAVGFPPEAAQTNLLGTTMQIPLGTVVVTKLRAQCEYNKKKSQYYVGMDVTEVHPAA